VTTTDDIERGRALASTAGFLVVVAAAPLAASLPLAVEIDPRADPTAIMTAVTAAIDRDASKHRTLACTDEIGAVPYDEYIELARYAMTRRYLIALLQRHGGSVTDAARGANLKRESLHRLMRRHHVAAEDFRER
jgi:DNA-binding NtrC family response regulator